MIFMIVRFLTLPPIATYSLKSALLMLGVTTVSDNPSWLAYSTLRSLCILHGIEVQNVSRRTLFNWRTSGVHHDHIDLLALRLAAGGFLSGDSIADIYRSCDYYP